MGDYIAYEKGLDGKLHPIIAAMNTLGYEVGTLGNHEFNYGLEFLDDARSRAPTSPSSRPIWSRANSPPTRSATPPRSRPTASSKRSITDGAGDTSHHQDRLHRLPAAADHDLGRHQSRRQGQHPRHRRDRQGLRPQDEGGRRRPHRRPLPFRHRRRSGPGRRKRLAAARRRRWHRRRPHRPPASGVPQLQGFRGPRRRRHRKGHARRQARRHGRLLGLAYGPHRPAARAGRRRQVDHRLPHLRSPPDLRARRRQGQAHWSKTRPRSLAAGQGRARSDPRLRPPPRRRNRRAAPLLLRPRRRRSVRADRQHRPDLVHRAR